MKKIFSIILVLALFIVPLATLAVDSPELPPTEPDIEEIIEEHQTIYRLTIYYVYLDGTTAAETYYDQLDAGTDYSVLSPEIEGYIATMLLVSGTMPARDVEWTVIYIPSEQEQKTEDGTDNPIYYFNGSNQITTIDDYETPLGLGASNMNVGICVE